MRRFQNQQIVAMTAKLGLDEAAERFHSHRIAFLEGWITSIDLDIARCNVVQAQSAYDESLLALRAVVRES